MHQELSQVANLVLFAKIVQAGGISRCAVELGMERTTVSRRLARLENELGVKLLVRTPKVSFVTKAGRLCYERCERLLETARSAQIAATNGEAAVNAQPIVVGAPPDILERLLATTVRDFETDNPQVRIDCYPVSRWADDLSHTADFILAWEKPSSGNVYVRKLVEMPQSVFASPEYEPLQGRIDEPRHIVDDVCIEDDAAGERSSWDFHGEEDRFTVVLRKCIKVSSMLEARASAIAGLGICRLPNYLCDQDVADGRLVKLLSEFESRPRSLYLIRARQTELKPRSTTLCLYIEDAFQSMLGRQ